MANQLPANVSSIGGKHDPCMTTKPKCNGSQKESGMVYWLKCIWQCLQTPQIDVIQTTKVTPDGWPITQMYRVDKDGQVCVDTFAINPETSQPEPYEGPCVKEQLNVNVQVEEGAQDVCVLTRPFDCEFFAADGPVKITNASLLDAISGALIGGTYPIDPATVCLNKIDFILMAHHDETEGGGTSWTSDATITDIETGKTKDVETGGGSCLSVPAGYDLHQFCIDVCHGSVVEICGEVSVRVDKATCEAIPKPAAKINLLDA